jgi:ribonuclease VapC
MIVLDTSAMIAILEGEPDAGVYSRSISGAPALAVSALQVHEAGIVLHRRHGAGAVLRLWRLLEENNVEIRAFDEPAARTAIAAYQRYGKGTGHPAQLNLADCAAYALARALNAPLLFKGDDFVHTDVARAA